MNNEQILEKLTLIFKENFDDDSLSISMNTTKDDIDEWDSFEQIRLIATIEDEFDVHFSIEELEKLMNIKNIVDILKLKLQ